MKAPGKAARPVGVPGAKSSRKALAWEVEAASDAGVAAVLRFSNDPHADASAWRDAAAAKAAPAELLYVRADMGELPDAMRQVQPLLGPAGDQDLFRGRGEATPGQHLVKKADGIYWSDSADGAMTFEFVEV